MNGIFASTVAIVQAVGSDHGPFDPGVVPRCFIAQVGRRRDVVQVRRKQQSQRAGQAALHERMRLPFAGVESPRRVHQDQSGVLALSALPDRRAQSCRCRGDQSAGLAEDAGEGGRMAQAGNHRVAVPHVSGELRRTEVEQARVLHGEPGMELLRRRSRARPQHRDDVMSVPEHQPHHATPGSTTGTEHQQPHHATPGPVVMQADSVLRLGMGATGWPPCPRYRDDSSLIPVCSSRR